MTQPIPSAPAPSWQETLLPIEASIQEAIACLDKSSMKIVVVIDSNGILVGTVTDGDIRRGLLRGLDIAGSVGGVVHRTPLVAPPQLARMVGEAADRVDHLTRGTGTHRLVQAGRRAAVLRAAALALGVTKVDYFPWSTR